MLRRKVQKSARSEPSQGKAKRKEQPRKGHVSQPKDQLALQKSQLDKLSSTHDIMDAHCFYLDWRQKTDGIDALLDAMDAGGIGMAALTGCPLKKSWVGTDKVCTSSMCNHCHVLCA